MNLKGFGNMPKGLKKIGITGALALFLLGLCFFLYLPKIKGLGKIKPEIVQVEEEIEKARKIEKYFEPASKEEERRWKEAESGLYLAIPLEKDIHQLTYELAKRAKKYNISNVSFVSGKAVNSGVSAGGKIWSESSSLVREIFDEEMFHFSVKLSFKADFRDLAYFLEDIQEIDRFIEIESLIVKRSFPLILVEMAVKSYYIQNQGESVPLIE